MAASALDDFLRQLGPEVQDPEEETFVTFSQNIPSANLGFVDSSATTLELSIGGQDLSIHQSPTVLSSNRAGGTTGAVVWEITPRFSEWLASPSNVFFRQDILSDASTVLELGCGVSALIGIILGRQVSRYILTDQAYVAKFVELNLEENRAAWSTGTASRLSATTKRARAGHRRPPKHAHGKQHATEPDEDNDRVHFRALDWEQNEVTPALTCDPAVKSFDAVIACDCIYNEALIEPLVQTCADACRLRPGDNLDSDTVAPRPCACIVAQQLRNPDVFEAWLKAFARFFRVWRIPDEELPESLRSDSGFAVHVGFLRQ